MIFKLTDVNFWKNQQCQIDMAKRKGPVQVIVGKEE